MQQINFEVKRTYNLLFTVTDNGSASGVETDEAAVAAFTNMTTTVNLIVTILDVNESPVMTDREGSSALAIDENAEAGTLIGPPLTGYDEDNDLITSDTGVQTLTYAIVGNSSGVDAKFEIEIGANFDEKR